MNNKDMNWVDKREEQIKEERSKGYFNIQEGSQQFVLLSHCAPYAQVFDNAMKKYRPAVEGDEKVTIRGLCWVLQDGLIKEAKLPYTVVKAIRALQQNPDWEFTVPFPHVLTLQATGAGKKEVEYSLTASPKETPILPEVLAELAKKPTPEEVVEKIKNRTKDGGMSETKVEYPEEEIDPNDIPFN